MVVVAFGNRAGGSWTGQILGSQGPVASLGITPSPSAIVGLYRTYVAISASNGIQRTDKDPSTDLYVLFNAWCPGNCFIAGAAPAGQEWYCRFDVLF